MGVGLRDEEVVDVEHLAEGLHRQVLLERAVAPAAAARRARGGPPSAVSPSSSFGGVRHQRPLGVPAEQVLRQEQQRERRRARDGGPDDDVRRREVVQDARRLVGVCGRDGDVEDAAAVLEGLEEGGVAQQPAQPLGEHLAVLERALEEQVPHELRRGGVGEEGEVEPGRVRKHLGELGVVARGDGRGDDGARRRPRQHAREQPGVEQRLDDAHVEGPEGPSPGEHQRRPPEGVPGLPQEVEHLVDGQRARGRGVGDGVEVQLDLVDVGPARLGRDAEGLVGRRGDGHVSQVADEVCPERKHHLADRVPSRG